MLSEIIEDDVKKLASEFGGELNRKKVLVTGGAGFIGSWLCDIVVTARGEVDCLDNFSTGKMENVKHLKDKIRLVSAEVEEAKLNGNYDYVFHFASRASPEEYQQHPVETMTSNATNTHRMLQVTKRSKS